MIITFLVLKKFLFKPVKKMIDDRQQEIDGLYADASHAKTQAEALQASMTPASRQPTPKGTGSSKMPPARPRSGRRPLFMRPQEKAARTMERAHAQVEREKKQAMNDLKDQVSGMAMGSPLPFWRRTWTSGSTPSSLTPSLRIWESPYDPRQ